MTVRKLKLESPVTGADVLAVLDNRLRELQERRDAVTAEIIQLEKTTALRPVVNANVAQTEALLDGASFVASPDRPMTQLYALHTEREAIDRALTLGRSRQHRLAAERATEIWAAHFPEIAAIEKRRVMLALELQQANRAREVLRDKITSAGGVGLLSTDGAELLGLGEVSEELDWCIERLISDGIMTRFEVGKARSNG